MQMNKFVVCGFTSKLFTDFRLVESICLIFEDIRYRLYLMKHRELFCSCILPAIGGKWNTGCSKTKSRVDGEEEDRCLWNIGLQAQTEKIYIFSPFIIISWGLNEMSVTCFGQITPTALFSSINFHPFSSRSIEGVERPTGLHYTPFLSGSASVEICNTQ